MRETARKGMTGCMAAMFMILIAACQSDWRDGIPQQWSEESVAFTAAVSSSRQATRADGTIINKGEKKLPATSLSKTESFPGYRVGIFGCYTGQNKWADLVNLSKKNAPTDEEKKTLENYYSANQMFNVPADIDADGKLTYSPLRFWPNNVVESALPSQTHEYMTFWAYYPYNASSSMGDYGIAITSDELSAGKGMGQVKFTMHPDAAQQNDFLISAPVTDCNRDAYPLLRTNPESDGTPTYEPQPVQFQLFHMLAQVRVYAFINGNDKMVYQEDKCTQAMLDTWDGEKFTDSHLDTEATKKYFRKDDGLTSIVPKDSWLQEGDVVNNITITADNIGTYADLKPAVMNELGSWVELKVGDPIPDESQCIRWTRSTVWNLSHTSQRPEITYTMELNNIKTSATFYPEYHADGSVTIDFDQPATLGSATINHYIMNPYWFTFRNGQRERLNDNYMFGYFEDTPVYNKIDATATMDGYDDIDGRDWTGTNDPLDYLSSKTTEEKEELKGTGDNASKHYNFAPGNILLVVPQELSDDDVPHIVITATGKTTKNGVSQGDATAKVTVNMLKMGISWESGYIYCYAFLDDLRPGDDKVRGPESITVVFDSSQYTDQW